VFTGLTKEGNVFQNAFQHDICLAINPFTPATLYAGGWGGVLRSTDSGTTWAVINTGLEWTTSQRVQCLAIDPLTPAILYAGTWYNGVLRSTDSGTTWAAVNAGLTDKNVRCLAINPLTPTTLYAGTNSGRIFRSTDSGTTWTVMFAGLTKEGSIFNWVNSLGINPVTPTTLYAGTYRDGVFCSTDSGTTWTEVNTGLTKTNVYSFAIDPLTPTTLYAGTDGGAFRSVNGGTTWVPANAGLPDATVYCLAINPTKPTAVYAGTFRNSKYSNHPSVFRYDTESSYALVTTVSPSASGSVAKSPNTADYSPVAVVTLDAIAAPGYTFAGWSGDLTSTTNPATVTMDADKTITATFAAETEKLTLKIGSSTMLMNGKSVALEAAPVILNSRTLLPIRAVVEAVGGSIVWDASTQKVTITRKDKTVDLWIGRNVANVSGRSVNVDSDPNVVPIIMSGRTLLPLRFVAEALALDVQWDAATKTITIAYAR
jgi:uncharacterized repeat protein (TIGR02543 family)